MSRSRFARWTTVAVAITCLGLALGSVSAEKKPEKKKTRVAQTKQLMKGLVFANCKALGAALKAEKTDWEEVSLRAALLNESGHVLMADGRCPDGVWAGAAKALRENGADIVAKAKDEDKAAVDASFKKLTTEGCAACHKEHKK